MMGLRSLSLRSHIQVPELMYDSAHEGEGMGRNTNGGGNKKLNGNTSTLS